MRAVQRPAEEPDNQTQPRGVMVTNPPDRGARRSWRCGLAKRAARHDRPRDRTVALHRRTDVLGHRDEEPDRRDHRPAPVRRLRGHPLRRRPATGPSTPRLSTKRLRCHYDAGNYQLAVETIIWRTYEQTLPPDALETTINGHRAAQYWAQKPTIRNVRYYMSCMVTFKTSYGVIQQSLWYSTVYSEPGRRLPVDQPAAGPGAVPLLRVQTRAP